ncbi:putative transcription factor bHLH041 isoform X1 [Primulina huaijiensis]|uniref:putative transcription factor bHLH041 isoform X1 n=1 Tax=Primulina huaijiensis TaxID=1492673 RepID=UPI003CC71660
MDSIFLLDEGDRSAFLRRMIQSVGSSYICLWSLYSPQPYNFLSFLDGIYHEISSQHPTSSSGSLARRLFNAYSQSENYMATRIPGFAFMNNVPYMELKEHDFQRMASSKVQLDFYREAGIKTVVFMSCPRGEIELGLRNEPPLGLEMEMNSLFAAIDFSQQEASTLGPQPAVDQNRPSSSSSSLLSLSFDSPDQYSPLMFNISTNSLVKEPQREAIIQEFHIENELKSVPFSATSMPFSSSHQQAMEDASQIQNFPITIESAYAAMTEAILAVLSSSSTSSPTQNIAPNLKTSPVRQNATPFQRYQKAIAPVAARKPKSNMFRRAVVFYRNLHLRRRQELAIQENRPTPAQLHHMINERKRREKFNESFQLLRSLLPVGSKKDKASVLSSTTEYLISLKSKVEELSKRNQTLEGQFLNRKEPIIQESAEGPSSSSSVQERVNVEMHRAPESTSEARILELRVTVRGECRMLDFVTGILEFLKQQKNLIRLLSIDSKARMAESDSVHVLVLRLRIEGDEFDESYFQEAVRKVVDDLTNTLTNHPKRFYV